MGCRMITLKKMQTFRCYQSAFYTPTHFCSIPLLVHTYTHTHTQSVQSLSKWQAMMVRLLCMSATFCLSSLIKRALTVSHISSLPLTMVLSTASAIKCHYQSVNTSRHLLRYTSRCYLFSAVQSYYSKFVPFLF